MNKRIQKITFSGLAIALIFLSIRFTEVPIPFGFVHIGNGLIFLFGSLLDPFSAFVVAAAGGALADITSGFPAWVVPTIITKGLMGWVVAYLPTRKEGSSKWVLFGASMIGAVINAAGYFLAGILLYGGVVASAVQIPFLLAEGFVGVLVFYVLYLAIKPFKKRLPVFNK